MIRMISSVLALIRPYCIALAMLLTSVCAFSAPIEGHRYGSCAILTAGIGQFTLHAVLPPEELIIEAVEGHYRTHGLEPPKTIHVLSRGSTKISRVIDNNGVMFDVTPRSYDELAKDNFNHSELDINQLKDGVVLDAGSGLGLLVRDFRGRFIRAWGIDLVQQEGQPYYLVRGDVRKMPFEANTFTHIYSSFSVFMYYGNKVTVLREILREFSRVLVRGGHIYLTSFDANILPQIIAEFPEFMIADGPYISHSGVPTMTIKKAD
jgi:hypothetical protein